MIQKFRKIHSVSVTKIYSQALHVKLSWKQRIYHIVEITEMLFHFFDKNVVKATVLLDALMSY